MERRKKKEEEKKKVPVSAWCNSSDFSGVVPEQIRPPVFAKKENNRSQPKASAFAFPQ